MPTAEPALSNLDLQCPPLPGTFVQAMDLLDTPDEINIDAVESIVARDPMVVTRLLHTINSSYHNVSEDITSVRRAIVLLGATTVLNNLVSQYLHKIEHGLNGKAQKCFRRLIRHSVATGFLARHLLERMQRVSPEMASEGFTAGLMHDFGKIVLVFNKPDQAVDLYEEKRYKDEISYKSLLEMERLLFGVNHVEAGRFAANRLDFPKGILSTITNHHVQSEALKEGVQSRILRAVIVANYVVKAMGYYFTEITDEDTEIYDAAWQYLLENDMQNDQTAPNDIIAILTDYQHTVHKYVKQMTHASARAREWQRNGGLNSLGSDR